MSRTWPCPWEVEVFAGVSGKGDLGESRLLVHQQILGLEVTVENGLTVDVAHHLDRLHYGPLDLRRCQPALGEHKLGEVAGRHQVHHEDEELGVLEGVPAAGQRGRGVGSLA